MFEKKRIVEITEEVKEMWLMSIAIRTFSIIVLLF